MQYLWINPVSAGMCEEDSLKRFLERHGLTRVGCLKRYRRSRKTNLELKT